MTATEVLVKVLDKVPSLRLVMDHLPDVRFPDRAAKDTYLTYLRELGTRPQVYIKLSEVVRKRGRQGVDRCQRLQGLARRVVVDLRRKTA